MDWIIRKSKLMPYHTHLGIVLTPVKDDIKNLQWLVSDLEYSDFEHPDKSNNSPLNMDDEYLILQFDVFQRVLNQNAQIYWGAFLGIPENKILDVHKNEIPYVEGNPLIWKPGNIQHHDALIEIDCFDSGYTIVKFSKKQLSDKFKAFFGNEAIELGKFNNC